MTKKLKKAAPKHPWRNYDNKFLAPKTQTPLPDWQFRMLRK